MLVGGETFAVGFQVFFGEASLNERISNHGVFEQPSAYFFFASWMLVGSRWFLQYYIGGIIQLGVEYFSKIAFTLLLGSVKRLM